MPQLNHHYERGQIRSLLELVKQQAEAMTRDVALCVHSLETSKLDNAMTYLIDAKAHQLEQVELMATAGKRLATLIRNLLPEPTVNPPTAPQPPRK